jgi:hypothetical protein
MKSKAYTAFTGSKAGNTTVVWSGTNNHQPSFVAVDTVTMDTATEVAANTIQLFGPGLNLEKCFLDPEGIRIRTAGAPTGHPTGAFSYTAKIQRVTAAGVVTDVTAVFTLNRALVTVAPVDALPQVELADTDTLRLYIVSVTTHLAGATIVLEVPFRRHLAPGYTSNP